MDQHFKIFKPYGYLSQFITNQKKRKNQKMLGELHEFPEGTMAVGRLDKDSEGLLFLTTNGKLSAKITGNGVEKEYWAQVDGIVSEESIKQLRDGVEISVYGKKYLTKQCEARILKEAPVLPARGKEIRNERHGVTSWISICLTEGKFRQVRKMTAAVGHPTLRLVRVRIGLENLQGMHPGEVRKVEEFHLE